MLSLLVFLTSVNHTHFALDLGMLCKNLYLFVTLDHKCTVRTISAYERIHKRVTVKLDSVFLFLENLKLSIVPGPPKIFAK